MVSKASEDLPEPDRPVITTRLSRGIATSMFLRLCSRAPRTTMDPAIHDPRSGGSWKIRADCVLELFCLYGPNRRQRKARPRGVVCLRVTVYGHGVEIGRTAGK